MITRQSSAFLPPLITTSGEMIEDNIIRANLLNDYFAYQSKCSLPDQEVPLSAPDRLIPVLEETIFTEDEVFDDLNRLNINKASGPDGIPHKVLKMIAIFLKEPLTKLFNQSLAGEKYPTV